MQTFLTVLSIIGYVLLGILGLVLFLVLLVLFFPFTYKISAKGEGKEWDAHLRILWLFGALRFVFDYPEPAEFRLYALWHQIKKKDEEEEFSDDIYDDASTKEPVSDACSESTSSERKDFDSSEKTTSQTVDSKNLEKQKNKQKNKQKPKKKPKNISYTFHEWYGKIKLFFKDFTFQKDLYTDNSTYDMFQVLLERTIHILYCIRPLNGRGFVDYGTGSPDTCAYIFGIWAMMRTLGGKKIKVHPDFECEEAHVKADVSITGAFCLLPIGIDILRFLWDKNYILWKKRREKHKVIMEKARRREREALKEYQKAE